MQSVPLYELLNDHLESAFKLTTKSESYFKNRSYMWLESLIDVCPKAFWTDRKRRTVKAIYTHAFEMARQTAEEPSRESALKIALKF
jgi:hypothetical protein